jgi:hypothetical protein
MLISSTFLKRKYLTIQAIPYAPFNLKEGKKKRMMKRKKRKKILSI